MTSRMTPGMACLSKKFPDILRITSAYGWLAHGKPQGKPGPRSLNCNWLRERLEDLVFCTGTNCV